MKGAALKRAQTVICLLVGVGIWGIGANSAHAVVPNAPSNLKTATASTSQINLDWTDNSSNETNFLIERKTGAGSFSQVASVGANVTSYTDSGLATATIYTYRVRATNSSGNSSYTSQSSAATSSSGVVGAWALNDVGTSEADYSGNGNRGTVQFTLPTTAGKYSNGLAFDGIYSSVNLGTPSVLNMTGSMTVSAWIKSTVFPMDDAAIVSKLSSLTPGGFQLDTTVDTGFRSIGFKLLDPSGADMARYGATVLQLNTWYHVAGVYDAAAKTMTVYLNGMVDNGALWGTVAGRQLDSALVTSIGERPDHPKQYNFNGTIDEVRIYNRALTQSEIQADMNAAIAPAAADTTAPSAPTGLGGNSPSTTQINIAWTGSTDTYDVVSYQVDRCQGASCSNFAQAGIAHSLSFNDTGLSPNTTYRYRVRGVDGAGNVSSNSSISSITTLLNGPSGGPVASYAFSEGTGSTTADASGSGITGTLSNTTWTASGKNGNALLYNGSTSVVSLGTPSVLQFTSSMTVSAWIKSSSYPLDDAAIVSKKDTSVPGGFQLDTTVDTGNRTIGFKLIDSSGADMVRYGATTLSLNTWYHVAGVYDAAAQTMTVYLNGANDNGSLLGTVGGTQVTTTLATQIGQRPDRVGLYNFAGTIDDVRIYNRALTQTEVQTDMNAGVGALDTTAPSAPSGLSATAASASQINLSWTASTDNVAVTGYRVERCQGASCSSFAQIATPTGTTLSDTGLTAATSYSYRVRATDAAGNLSSYSSTASATTASAATVQLYFIHPDHLDTPRLISNSTPAAVWRWDNDDAFGGNAPNQNPSGLGAFTFNLRFPGQYFDQETNDHYNYFRDYSPEIGRYIESDPIGLRSGTNTFAYVRSSPLLYLDGSGLDPNLTSLARQIAKCLCSIDPFYCTNLNSIGSGTAGLRDLFGIPTAGSTSVFGDITISQNLYGGTPNLPIPVTPPTSPPATATSPDALELAETVAHEINHQKLDSPIRRMFTENPQAAANAQALMSPANKQKILNCLNCTNTQ